MWELNYFKIKKQQQQKKNQTNPQTPVYISIGAKTVLPDIVLYVCQTNY